jgi:diaminohydroxyphosphoribosylaminopyrimidine deaminase/5-amino-6-(5-phosphoribosylamino)uracil reductase
MAHALAIGARNLGATWPNPAVGCVIVKSGRVIGRGWTARGGRPHAEPQALEIAGPAARGATAFVTLEPCGHQGQTPPCAEALVAAGVARVVAAIKDPHPLVDGGGLKFLKDNGISVETGLLEAAARQSHRGFLTRVRLGRPMVTLKLASSFDGRIATAAGESRWITGPGARRMVHALRLSHDAVLIGGGTARADDPDLTVRDIGAPWQPVRVVASRHLQLPATGRLAASVATAPLWLAHGDGTGDVEPTDRDRWNTAGATLLPVTVAGSGQLDPAALLAALGERGLTRVFCEGGGALAASLLQADLVDEVVGFTAGVVLGAEGQPSLGAMGIGALEEAPRFTLIETRAVAGDVLHRWARAR